jgi:hypothetical protein
MKDYGREDKDSSFNLQSLLQFIRACGAVLGLVTIVIGLVYATRLFSLVLTALGNPEVFEALLGKWVEAVGGDTLDLSVAGTTFHGAPPLAIGVLGGGVFILTWLSMGLIGVGAKTVSWLLGDREAVKKVLAHALGPARRSEPGAAGENPSV